MIDISDVTSDSLAVDVAVLTGAVAETGGTDAVAGLAVVSATGGKKITEPKNY
jgi:hypothetical protein